MSMTPSTFYLFLVNFMFIGCLLQGIHHLCSELLELKAESDEDFQMNVLSNYTAFLK